jgi:hypothetical protein
MTPLLLTVVPHTHIVAAGRVAHLPVLKPPVVVARHNLVQHAVPAAGMEAQQEASTGLELSKWSAALGGYYYCD